MNTTDLDCRRAIMLKGKSGVGKTSQARTLVHADLGVSGGKSFGLEPFKILYVSSERKWVSIKDLHPDVFPVTHFDFPLDTPEKKMILSQCKEAGLNSLIEAFDIIRFEDHDYDVMYMDSGMRYSMKVLEHLIATTFSKEGNRDTLRAYGLYARKMKMMLDKIGDLTDPTVCKRPVHVVFTWGSDSGQVIVEGQKVGPLVDYFFDDVLYLATRSGKDGNPEYIMETQTRSGNFEAKVSNPTVKLPPVIANPNLFQIINILDGKLELGGGAK